MQAQILTSGLKKAFEDKLFTAAAVRAQKFDQELFSGSVGVDGPQYKQPTNVATVFDLASLTKILATTPCWMVLEAGDPGLIDKPISRLLSSCPSDKREITPRLLLAHSSGLPAWRPYYLYRDVEGSRIKWTTDRILFEKLEYRPGHDCIYSDLGFILLGRLLETLTGIDLAEFSNEEVIKPLGLETELGFSTDLARTITPLPSIAQTRFGEPPGLVHDLNARALGGTAGHAGLFGTAHAVAHLGLEILKGLRGRSDLFDESTVKEFCSRSRSGTKATRALGFDTPCGPEASCGRYYSVDSIGHTGFTGTSLWIDPHTDLIVTLLTNRVIMGEHDFRIKSFRRQYHEVICQSLLSAE